MKEKIEKLLKSHLKRKLTITTATLIAFLLSSNLSMAGQNYRVGNGKIERDISESWNFSVLEDATEYLGSSKTGLFEILETNIVNRLKDESNFTLLEEVDKPFINEGNIYKLINNGIGKIENRGSIVGLDSKVANEIENRGLIWNFTSKGNIANKGSIYSFYKAKDIVNDGYIGELKENKNITNNGIIEDVYNGTHIADIVEIKNNGIIGFKESAYNAIEKSKIKNNGIVLVNDIFQGKAPNSSTIENYHNEAIPNSIENKILNAYEGKIENNLEVKNNSILNIRKD